MVTGLLIFVVLEIFAPTIAWSVQAAQPAFPAYDDMNATGEGNITVYPSEWTPAHNAGLPYGTTEWTTNIRILGIVILVISISLALVFLRNMA